MTAEEAIKLDEPKFIEWAHSAPTTELKRVFSVCALSTHSQQWEVARLELEERRHLELLRPHWVLWATLVAGTIAALAAVILLFR